MAIGKKTKSANFDANLDAKRMLKAVSTNVSKLAQISKGDMNVIAPIDSGKLRNSANIQTKQFSFTIVWDVPYSQKRYFNNKKNPKTKKWVDKAIKKNKKKYIAIMQKGVVK